MSGHFGEKRTLLNFKDRYFWPSVAKDVRNCIRSCNQCNRFNPPLKGYEKAPLQPIESKDVFQFVSYDIAGPFQPETCRRNRYVLIIKMIYLSL